jgi:hypothetical protein
MPVRPEFFLNMVIFLSIIYAADQNYLTQT